MKGRVSPSPQRAYPLTMICAVYRVPRSSVYAAERRPAPSASAPLPGPKPPAQRRRGGGGDSRDPGRVPLPWRRLSQSASALGPSRPADRGQARPAAHARPRVAGAAPPGAAEWQPGPRRHHHHRPAGRDVGHGRPALLHRARGLVLVLRRHRSPSRRDRRVAHREAGGSLGCPRAHSPRRPPCLRSVRQGRRAGLEAAVRPGARSTSPTPGSTR